MDVALRQLNKVFFFAIRVLRSLVFQKVSPVVPVSKNVGERFKAFDRVWHAGLLHKLKSYGISGQIFGAIFSFSE